MHACGDDGHTAILLAAARACAQSADFGGTIHFIFQPPEENEGGARHTARVTFGRRQDCHHPAR
ncbi:M20/M25/M40 family metallo-hydrolase [Microvirga massiliensis]|uniref:M20/M25/M40 family metallo-hydrolase n=1 Tax=Microvirga massiliensis TaxID=1033741 RepID=UPI00093FA2F0|nr:M20/M25/M40 family metallo-hydrolase [Microvirga massiliensis]